MESLQRTIVINAKPAEVWEALTNPELTKKYMFNCEVISTWAIGSPIVWKGNYQGYETGENGIILNCEKEKQLKYSSFDPNFGLEDIPENYLHITYDLLYKDGQTELTFTADNFNNDPKRLPGIGQMWDTIVLPAFKELFV